LFLYGVLCGSDRHSKAFPAQRLSTCFYQDYDSRMTEVQRRRKACQVDWVEVEVEAGKKPRPWSELKTILLDSLQQVCLIAGRVARAPAIRRARAPLPRQLLSCHSRS
jgi:hypothetical protein